MASLFLHPSHLSAHHSVSAGSFHITRICPSSSPKTQIVRAQNSENSDRPDKPDGGQRLWRNDLRQQRPGVGFSDASQSWSDEAFLDLSVEQDIQRLAQQRDAEKRFSTSSKNVDEKRGGKGLIVKVVEKLLVADFFFILFILGWLFAGLAEQAAFETHVLIDAWLPFWPIVFQPALGFFMAGALWSAVSKFFSNR